MVRKVLLADDNKLLLLSMANFLKMSGQYEVLLAEDGEEALEIAKREKPSLVIADIKMPKKDGFEVCRFLKEKPATAYIKVILVSGLSQEFYELRSTSSGADDYLSKPFTPAELLDKVNRLLAQS